MTVRRIEIQCAGDVVEVAERKELKMVSALMPLERDTRRDSSRDLRSSFVTVIDLTYLHLEMLWGS
jgi:hypothetical protein